MDASDARTNKGAFWCGILEGDTPSIAPGREVRTVRGMYTTLRESPKKRGAATRVLGDPQRSGGRLP